MRPPALMFGVPIADLTMDETVALIEHLVAEGRAHRRTHQIATVNVDFLVNAIDNDDVMAILQGADVCLPDGMPIVWGAAMLGMPIRERVAGSDLVPLLVDASRTNGLHVHVFGSSERVAEAALAKFATDYPGARVSIDPGPMITDVGHVDDEVLESIAAVDADVLCVALGNPKQEHFIRAHRVRLGVPVMIGVGGSLDMFVGERRRAPAWVQRIGLEWVVRAAQEPRRLGRRYAHDIVTFGPALVRETIAVRRVGTGGLALDLVDGLVGVRVGPDTNSERTSWARAAERIAAGDDVSVEWSGEHAVRRPTLAELVGLVQLARRSGSTVAWTTDPGSDVRRHLGEVGVTPGMIGLPLA